jgi:hypothetical protein
VATQRERLITVTPVEILPMMWIPGSLPTINSMLIGLFRFDGGGAAPHTDRRVALAGPATQMGALLTIGATSSRRQGALSYKFFISQGSAARRLLARSFARAICPKTLRADCRAKVIHRQCRLNITMRHRNVRPPDSAKAAQLIFAGPCVMVNGRGGAV